MRVCVPVLTLFAWRLVRGSGTPVRPWQALCNDTLTERATEQSTHTHPLDTPDTHTHTHTHTLGERTPRYNADSTHTLTEAHIGVHEPTGPPFTGLYPEPALQPQATLHPQTPQAKPSTTNATQPTLKRRETVWPPQSPSFKELEKLLETGAFLLSHCWNPNI